MTTKARRMRSPIGALIVSLLTILALMPLGLFSQAAHAQDSAVKQTIPLTKIWEGDTAADRPATVTVELVKYVGDPSNGTVIETATVDAAGNWAHNFDITGEPMFDAAGNQYQFMVREQAVPGYTQVAATQPAVKFELVGTAGQYWDRVTTNSSTARR